MKINVGVFFGGRSVEHEVAVISAVQAMNSMDTEKYNILPVYITKQGEMYYNPAMLDINLFKDIPALLKNSIPVTMIKQGESFCLIELKKGLFKKTLSFIDIAFPIVHGTNCEDGAIAGWFELLGIPYVGCDTLSASVGMDKAAFKYILMQHDIPVLPCVTFHAKTFTLEKQVVLNTIKEKLQFPLIIKPVNLGSSVGISKAADEAELIESIREAMHYAEKILVEPAITDLREFNCSVVGDMDACDTSVIEEPIMTGDILSYDDKYKNGDKGGKTGGKSSGMASLKRKIPADIPPQLRQQIETYAKSTFQAIGANGVVRIDFIFDAKNEQVYVNEINTIPGSLSFYLWEPKGVPYKELLTKLIDLGFKRSRTKENLTFSFDTNILSQGGAFGSKGKK